MTKDVIGRRHVIIESCGLNWRLATLLNSGIIKRRPLLTIAFNGNTRDLLERVKKRQKRPLPEPFISGNEWAAVHHVVENLHSQSVANIDYEFYTTQMTEDHLYHEVSATIHKELLLQNGRKETRPDFQVNRFKSEIFT